jgi:Uncharacterized protein conserved in bacteria
VGRLSAALFAAAAAFLAPQGAASGAELREIPVTTRTISHFKVGATQSRFGPLEFVGGLELTSSSRALGAMSSIRLAGDRASFLGVMDTGHWFAGKITRDERGRPAGISQFSIAPMLDRAGRESFKKWLFDSEGMTIRGDEILVSFEREHRVDVYPAKDPAGSRPIRSIPILVPERELRGNRGFEAIAVAPQDSPLAGSPIIVSERSLNKAGDLFAAILEGPLKGIFFVRRHAPYDVTDGDFLPDGDLLLLERRFSIADGIGMRIRRIKGSEIRPGATVDGEVLLEADFGYQIDNMEGLDVTTDEKGDVFVTLVSDDNHSILQRNLILEFRVVGDSGVPN